MKWHRCRVPATEEDITQLLTALGYSLPEAFLNILLECDAGMPKETDFSYFNTIADVEVVSSLGCFLGIKDNTYNILENFLEPPEFFPEGLLAFAETGNGDFICFDYREDPKSKTPQIVYWEHDAPISEEEVGSKDVFFVAKDFETFIDMLYEPVD